MYRVKKLCLDLSRLSHRSSKLLNVCRPCSSKVDKDGKFSPQSKHRKYATQAAAEPFLNGSSSIYVEEMYSSWLNDPKSVHKSWDSFFKQTSQGAQPGEAYVRPPSLGGSIVPGMLSGLPSASDQKNIEDHLAVQSIIRSYQLASIGDMNANWTKANLKKCAKCLNKRNTKNT